MHLEKPYIISLYAIIRNEESEFLLLKRSEESHVDPGKWDLPGGKMEREEILENAIVREVREETGITIIPGEIAGYTIFERPEKKEIGIVYDGKYVTADVKLSPEHTEYKWVSQFRIMEMDSLLPYFKDFFKRLL
jgi:8-oxo-dGTP diphosphatase